MGRLGCKLQAPPAGHADTMNWRLEMSKWKKNEGKVPAEITHDGIVAIVRYRDGVELEHAGWDDPDYWELWENSCDIVEWRLA